MESDDAAETEERLDKVVAERFKLSRRLAREAIQRGRVDVGGELCLDPARTVAPGDEIAHHPNRPRPETVQRRVTILHEDDETLIIDKPAGLLTQPTQDRERDTLLERAGRYLLHKRGVKHPYIGIVHRIDQQTSGAILVVTSPRALRPFQALFRERATQREYLAVVEGVFLTPEGTIDLPLVEGAERDGRRGVAREPGRGVEAVTRYRVVESYGKVASLVSINLETGRTHQARIHMAAIGHPVVGDPVYGRRGRAKFSVEFPRQALHAASLSFTHPTSGEPVRAEAPLPADMVGLIDELKRRYGAETG